MFKSLLTVLCSVIVLFSVTVTQARALLEKPLFFVQAEDGKIGTCKYWVIVLGTYPLQVARKFPGEDTTKINVDLKYQMVSSGYVEGNGYCSKGKIESQGSLMIKTDAATNNLSFDSLSYVAEYGDMVKTKKGDTGKLMINAEGSQVEVSQLLLRKFRLEVDMGDTSLKLDGDVSISAFAFAKEKIAEAVAAMKKAAAPK